MIGNYQISNNSMNNVIQGIRLRANRLLSNLQNIDYSNSPELSYGVDILNRISRNQVNQLSLFKNRSKVYKIFDQLEYGLNQLSDYNYAKSYSGARSVRGASTVSGNDPKQKQKPKPAMSKGIKQKNSMTLKNNSSGLTDYIPYVVIGGVVLLMMFSGYKTTKSK